MVKWIIGALVVLVIMLGVFMAMDPNLKSTQNAQDTTTEVVSEKGNTISVKIEGQVLHPGTYTMYDTSTVGDLIEKAGGLLASADTDSIDEGVVIGTRTLIYVSKISGYSDTCIATDAVEKVNINSATAEELATISGVSLTLGQKIVQYREENGDFETLEDIQNVSGIGEKTYEKIRDYICIR